MCRNWPRINKIIFLVYLNLSIIGCLAGDRKDFNVVFISLDTTRNDHVDTGRGATAYTPELRKFSTNSIVFENAFATIPLTLPSHLSVFTSYLPHDLGVFSNEYKYDGRFKMIQQALEERGYHTGAIISLGTLASGTGFRQGFKDFRDDLFEEDVFFVPAERITSEAIRAIQKFKDKKFFLFVHYSDPHTPYAPPGVEGAFEINLDGKLIADFNSYRGAVLRKTFLFSKGSHLMKFRVKHSFEDFSYFIIRKLNFSEGCSMTVKNLEFSPELYGGSYVMKHPESQINIMCQEDSWSKIFQIIPILKKKAALEYYRMEVEHMDNSVGKFLRELEESGLSKKTIVVIFGDHGEAHGERENFFGHTRYLNRQFIHVPLIMRFPGFKGTRYNLPVSLVCIAPTVLESLGIRDKSFNQSESVGENIKKAKFKEKPVYSFTFGPSTGINKLSIIKWPYQAIFYFEQERQKKHEFYNLALSQSFCEKDVFHEEIIRKNSKQDYEIIQKKFKQLMVNLSSPSVHKKISDKKMIEKIRALGYINK
jgi:hypothetical protein